MKRTWITPVLIFAAASAPKAASAQQNISGTLRVFNEFQVTPPGSPTTGPRQTVPFIRVTVMTHFGPLIIPAQTQTTFTDGGGDFAVTFPGGVTGNNVTLRVIFDTPALRLMDPTVPIGPLQFDIGPIPLASLVVAGNTLLLGNRDFSGIDHPDAPLAGAAWVATSRAIASFAGFNANTWPYIRVRLRDLSPSLGEFEFEEPGIGYKRRIRYATSVLDALDAVADPSETTARFGELTFDASREVAQHIMWAMNDHPPPSDLCAPRPTGIGAAPYLAIDPVPCDFSDVSWEEAPIAVSEGFATAFATITRGRLCDERRPFNPDGDNGPGNIEGVFCDLMDDSNEEVAYLHAVPAGTGRITVAAAGTTLDPLTGSNMAGNNQGVYAGGVGANAATIFRMTASGPATPLAVLPADVTRVAADDSGLFALDINGGLHVIAPNGAFTTVAAPVIAPDETMVISDVSLGSVNQGGTLVRRFALLESTSGPSGTSRRVWSGAPIGGAMVWTLLATLPALPGFRVIEVTDGGRIFLATARRLYELIPSLGTAIGVAGTEATAGYARGNDAWFSNIIDLELLGGRLTIVDDSGVSEFVPNSGPINIRQIVGIGADNVYIHELAERALNLDWLGAKAYSESSGPAGTFGFLDAALLTTRLPDRDTVGPPRRALVVIDPSVLITEQVRCGYDDVSTNELATISVLRAWDAADRMGAQPDLRGLLETDLGLATPVVDALLALNWVEPLPPAGLATAESGNDPTCDFSGSCVIGDCLALTPLDVAPNTTTAP